MSVFNDLLDGKEVLNEINNETEEHIQMCSSWQDELDEICSCKQDDTCGGNNSVAESLRQKSGKLF